AWQSGSREAAGLAYQRCLCPAKPDGVLSRLSADHPATGRHRGPEHDTERRVRSPDSALVIIPHAYHAFTLEKAELTADLLARFAEDVLAGKWKGGKSVWIAP